MGNKLEQRAAFGFSQTQLGTGHRFRSNLSFGPDSIGRIDLADYGVCAMAQIQTISDQESLAVSLHPSGDLDWTDRVAALFLSVRMV